MADTHPPAPAKLIAGMLAREPAWFDLTANALAARFGLIDLRSGVIRFDFTHYYDDQVGVGLNRQFVSFERLIDPATLADAKLFTNALEAELAEKLLADVPRPVNIDPGYLTEAKLVLASAKDFSHRIYLRDGIYAEITLHYGDGAWQPWPWTFPDYRTDAYRTFFQEVRRRLRQQLGRT